MEFNLRCSKFGGYAKEIQRAAETSSCPKEFRYLYETMPLSDAVNYPPQLIESFVRHAQTLKKKTPWCRQWPEELYLTAVLFPRVNTEQLCDCRKKLYHAVWPRIQGMSLTEAIKEVNYWCLEQMSYRSTDERTASVDTMLRCGFGRCGEESVFTVSALRSVGIPARQVYVPRWSHCDDNHAWVEVWCGDGWHYLGACEPEPELDRGWFTSAASRAMMVHSRSFGQPLTGEKLIAREGNVYLYNQLDRYADTVKLTVCAVKKEIPVKDTVILAQVANGAAFETIARLTTNEDGIASVITGKGSLQLRIIEEGKFFIRRVLLEEDTRITLDLDDLQLWEQDCEQGTDYDLAAPQGRMETRKQLSGETAQLHRTRCAQADVIRQNKQSAFWNWEQAKNQFEQLGFSVQDAQAGANLLSRSYGNEEQILKFLNQRENRLWRIRILETLTEKDLIDFQPEPAEEALAESMRWQKDYPDEFFLSYLLSPRIELEPLSCYRKYFRDSLSKLQRQQFIRNPQQIWQWILSEIQVESQEEYDALVTLPRNLVAAGRGSLRSCRLLFVAICRSLGIPARLAPEDGRVQYWDREQERFAEAVLLKEGNEPADLCLELAEENRQPVYRVDWSLSRLQGGYQQNQNFAAKCWSGKFCHLQLMPGHYRLLACKRMPNGAQMIREYRFTLEEGEKHQLRVQWRTDRLTDYLEAYPLPDCPVVLENGESGSLQSVYRGQMSICMWLKPGQEPTAHLLNELREQTEMAHLPVRLVFLVSSLAERNAVIKEQIVSQFPQSMVLESPAKDQRTEVARAMYVDPDQLPLAVVVSPEGKGIYAVSGYQVGLGALLTQVIRETLLKEHS